MRQSLSETADRTGSSERTSPRTGSAVGFLLGALGLSVALAVAALVDQLGARTLMDHASDVYASHGEEPGPGVMYGLLYSVAVVGVLLWLVALGGARLGRRWAWWATVVASVVMAVLAVTLLAASEYGEEVFPPFWGVVALLPPLAGAMAVVPLVGRRSR